MTSVAVCAAILTYQDVALRPSHSKERQEHAACPRLVPNSVTIAK
jgi:hypothetical protein